jgi:hypothetical protein
MGFHRAHAGPDHGSIIEYPDLLLVPVAPCLKMSYGSKLIEYYLKALIKVCHQSP